MTEWIKSEEQLPDFLGDNCNFSDVVLVYFAESNYYMIACCVYEDGIYSWSQEGSFLAYYEPIDSTYWMPLPNKPKV